MVVISKSTQRGRWSLFHYFLEKLKILHDLIFLPSNFIWHFTFSLKSRKQNVDLEKTNS